MELAISILGYITQLTQIIGWRINLLLGTFLFGSLSWFTFSEELYANAIIRAVAAVVCFLGFLNWKTSIYIFKKWHLVPYLLIVFFVAVIQLEFTNNPAPMLDTTVASLGLIATFLMASRSIYCWILLMTLNAMETIMFFTVHNYYLSMMQFIYLLTSVAGIVIWKKRGVDRSLPINQ
ncbi:hypothetical protein LO80_07285 [Candidatus Francisella endociliophora]|uniref:Uncharacterized protein n=1 Tax=Candidatus Francisella endociliophora TaxID=653937 RepID=A0A097EQD7_9GAMM|nr:nicotinamide mononucleotide transporter [Francisella sp. FSC1006]AIT09789.1 hypothetical protein LO80_07285 [Francisella sp. FSC1006]